MNKSDEQINARDDSYKLLASKNPVYAIRATIISYLLTLLIPTIAVGSFLHLIKDNLLNSPSIHSSVNKNSNFISRFILDNFNKADKKMDILNKPHHKPQLKKIKAIHAPIKYKKYKTKIPNKTYISRVYRPGETKMKMIIVEKK